jgi:hypothetical protein
MTKDRIQKQKGELKCPEWRLYANFLHRELARLWYGKKSIFTLVMCDKDNEEFWGDFGLILTATMQKFGQAHGLTLTTNELVRRTKHAYEEYTKLTGLGFPLGTLAHEIYWMVRRILGDKLASDFLYDFQITEIIILAVCAYGYAAEGKKPPYEKGARLASIEFYEGLPVAPELEKLFYDKPN